MSRKGRLIAFEGTEGAGKSTQVRLAAAALRAEGCDVVVTAAPGATVLGRELREILLHGDAVPTPVAELFLYLADRAQHVDEVIRPALAHGRVVLVDRFTASTIAYQGYGRELEIAPLRDAERWARGGLDADLSILLDCPVRSGLERARGDDRFHREEEAFHERVRAGFQALAEDDPDRWCVIDTGADREAVHARILVVIRECLAER